MQNGKGRIDPWQPKRKQRRKAAKSTRHLQQGNERGRDERPLSFLWQSLPMILI
jgi:hypothetical protein